MHSATLAAARQTNLRYLGPLAGAAGVIILASACGTVPPHQASPTTSRPRPALTAAAATSRPKAAPAASQPATPAPAASTVTAPAYNGPHFNTPQAAMAYLAAAYNRDDIAALHAISTPQAFTSLRAMRASDTDLRLTSCAPRQSGDYVCGLRYSYSARGHNPESMAATIIAAPALSPGWYMFRFVEGCD